MKGHKTFHVGFLLVLEYFDIAARYFHFCKESEYFQFIIYSSAENKHSK